MGSLTQTVPPVTPWWKLLVRVPRDDRTPEEQHHWSHPQYCTPDSWWGTGTGQISEGELHSDWRMSIWGSCCTEMETVLFDSPPEYNSLCHREIRQTVTDCTQV